VPIEWVRPARGTSFDRRQMTSRFIGAVAKYPAPRPTSGIAVTLKSFHRAASHPWAPAGVGHSISTPAWKRNTTMDGSHSSQQERTTPQRSSLRRRPLAWPFPSSCWPELSAYVHSLLVSKLRQRHRLPPTPPAPLRVFLSHLRSTNVVHLRRHHTRFLAAHPAESARLRASVALNGADLADGHIVAARFWSRDPANRLIGRLAWRRDGALARPSGWRDADGSRICSISG